MQYESRFLPGVNIDGFTYDNISLEPRYSDFRLDEIDTSCQLTKNIRLKIPVVSAPMDTVTGHKMAIALALEGGFGFLDYNTENLGNISEEVRLVKRFESGFVEDPVTLSPEDLLDKAARIRMENGISTIPITEDGKPAGKLVGILTKNDYSMLVHKGRKIGTRMTKLEKMTTVKHSELPIDPEQRLEYANNTLLESHLGTLPIVDGHGNLVYLVTRSDLEKNEQYPLATKDKKKRLRVGIAVGPKPEYKEVVQEAMRYDIDAIVLDTSHGNCAHNIKYLKYLKSLSDDIDVVAGSVSTPDGAERLIKAGADAIRVNAASGTSCITEIMTGVGTPQGTAVYKCALVGEKYGIPIIADGGLEKPGDITKALALNRGLGKGKGSVMTGFLLSGCDEAPGWYVDETGRRFKIYRGMGSIGAMKKRSGVRYGSSMVPQGVEAEVEPTGSVHYWVGYLITCLKLGMEKVGARTIPDLGAVRIGPRISTEAGVHGLTKYKKVLGMSRV